MMAKTSSATSEVGHENKGERMTKANAQAAAYRAESIEREAPAPPAASVAKNRVTLELTHKDDGQPLADWPWRCILAGEVVVRRSVAESVRVVEDDALDAGAERLREERDAAIRQREEFRRSFHRSEEAGTRLVAERDASLDDAAGLRARVAELESEKAAAIRERDELRDSYRHCRAANTLVCDERDALKARVAELESHIVQRDAAIESVVDRAATAEERSESNMEAQRVIHTLTRQRDAAIKRAEAAELLHEMQKDMMAHYVSRIEALNLRCKLRDRDFDEWKKAETRVAELEGEKAAAIRDRDDAARNRDRLHGGLGECQARVSRLEEDNLHFKKASMYNFGQWKQAEARVTELKGELVGLSGDVRAAEKEADRLRGQLESVADRAAAAENALEAAPAAIYFCLLGKDDLPLLGDEYEDDQGHWHPVDEANIASVCILRPTLRRRVPAPAASGNVEKKPMTMPSREWFERRVSVDDSEISVGGLANRVAELESSAPAASGAGLTPHVWGVVRALIGAAEAVWDLCGVPLVQDEDRYDSAVRDLVKAIAAAESLLVNPQPAFPASGAAGTEVVGWGVRMKSGKYKGFLFGSEKDAQKCAELITDDTVPLFAEPQPALGWLTPEERSLLSSLADGTERRATEIEKMTQSGMTLGSGLPKASDCRADAAMLRSLLARSPDAKPSGWLTPDDRKAVEYFSQFVAGHLVPAEWSVMSAKLRSLLARETPEVVRPAVNGAAAPAYVAIVEARDAEWLAAIAASGGKVKEVG